MTLGVFERPEPGLPFEPSPPATRGMVAHNLETGRSACHRIGCGWVGVTPYVPVGPKCPPFPARRPGNGVLAHECPRCVGRAFDHELEHTVLVRFGQPRAVSKISRNAPCPCGSGLKAKKCSCGALSGALSA